jgi:hypothetical protein
MTTSAHFPPVGGIATPACGWFAMTEYFENIDSLSRERILAQIFFIKENAVDCKKMG